MAKLTPLQKLMKLVSEGLGFELRPADSRAWLYSLPEATAPLTSDRALVSRATGTGALEVFFKLIFFFSSVFQTLSWGETCLKSSPHICVSRCCLPMYGNFQQRPGKTSPSFPAKSHNRMCTVFLCSSYVFLKAPFWLLVLIQGNRK